MKKNQITTLNNQNNFKNNKINPILSYFSFTTKYIFKKKSTFIFPIISFISVLLISLSITFLPLNQDYFSDEEQQKRNWETFLLIWNNFLLPFSIAILGMFATIKALNLFKDVSSEGLEILIVSKPIERWQIIFVRFFYFLLLGIGLSLVNYFAALIGLLSLPNKFIPNSFSMFGNITIYFFSILLSYIFFGAISILLSLKFSTKLVTSFSSSIMAIGLIVAQSIPLMVSTLENGFYYKLSLSHFGPDSDSEEEQTYFDFYLTTNNEVIIYDSGKNLATTLTDDQKRRVEDSFNNKDDLSWITILNNFANPIAGLTKISSNKPSFIVENNQANFIDYNVSLNKGAVISNNNEFDGNNHFLSLKNEKQEAFSFQALNNIGTIQVPIDLQFSYSNFNNYIGKEEDKLNKSFDKTLNYILNKSSENTNNKIIIDKIIENSEIFYNTHDFDLMLRQWIHSGFAPWSPEHDTYLATLNLNDVKNQTIILSFYLYSLDKINSNSSNFSIEDKKLFFSNLFFGKSFKLFKSDGNVSLFTIIPAANNNYFTLSNKGEKVSSVAVGASWSAIISVILISTIIIYYRKDFV